MDPAAQVLESLLERDHPATFLIQDHDVTLFRCPITNEIMQDPVIAMDGFTYEGEAIRRWLSKHNTSPLTRDVIRSDLIPNKSLKASITAFVDSGKRLIREQIALGNTTGFLKDGDWVRVSKTGNQQCALGVIKNSHWKSPGQFKISMRTGTDVHALKMFMQQELIFVPPAVGEAEEAVMAECPEAIRVIRKFLFAEEKGSARGSGVGSNVHLISKRERMALAAERRQAEGGGIVTTDHVSSLVGGGTAMYQLALVHIQGRSAPIDRTLGEVWLHAAAVAENAEAQFHLGQLLWSGSLSADIREQGREWLRRAAMQGHGNATRMCDEALQSATCANILQLRGVLKARRRLRGTSSKSGNA